MDKKAKISWYFLCALTLLTFLLPYFLSVDPNQFDPLFTGGPTSPSLHHPFGTDELGRDILLRSIIGAKISLLVGFVSVIISVTIGVLLGITAGYKGGIVDELIMRSVDVFLAIPTLFLILTIQVILSPSIYNVIIVIGLTSWMSVTRLVRAEVLSIKERPYILFAKSKSTPKARLIFKHILPHTLTPVIVAAMLGMGQAILTESVLSFLGLGVQPPHASWGNMLDNSLTYILDAPWMTIAPGILITTTVLALNFLADGCRTILDPRSKTC